LSHFHLSLVKLRQVTTCLILLAHELAEEPNPHLGVFSCCRYKITRDSQIIDCEVVGVLYFGNKRARKCLINLDRTFLRGNYDMLLADCTHNSHRSDLVLERRSNYGLPCLVPAPSCQSSLLQMSRDDVAIPVYRESVGRCEKFVGFECLKWR
jgi:hypothetical protein